MLFTSSCTSIDLQSRTAPSFRSLTSSTFTYPLVQGITGHLLSLNYTTVIPGHLRWCSTLQIVDPNLGKEATPTRGGFFPSCIFLNPERRGKRRLPNHKVDSTEGAQTSLTTGGCSGNHFHSLRIPTVPRNVRFRIRRRFRGGARAVGNYSTRECLWSTRT